MKQLITLNQLISKYLMILIIVFSCIAYIVPSYFSWAIAYTPFLLGIAMFGMGLTIKFEDLCSMFDFFIFPSRFEGLGVALLEAQANGVPILASDVIPPEVIVNSNYHYLSLSDSPIKWAEKILELQQEKRIDTNIVKNNLIEKGFDLVSETKKIENILLDK